MSIETFESALLEFSEKSGVRKFFIRRDFPLRRLTSFRIGGNADAVVYPKDAEAFAFAVDQARRSEMPYLVLGNGSNTLASDKGYRGVVLATTDMRRVEVDKDQIRGGCGVLLGSIGTNAACAQLSGAEFANGIPGTLGGAIYMNAGAYGGQFSDIVLETECYDPDTGNFLTLRKDAHAFGYRKSIFMETNYIILSALLQLQRGDEAEIRDRMRLYLQSRREKQPLEYPSAGSIFKRPEGNYAGKLIEEAGLKGAKIGGAMVSPKHAGFIVNTGGATADDVLRLIELVQARVLKSSGVRLECEVRFIGEK